MTDTPALRIDPPAFLAEPALAAVMAALPEARVVGGAVRDALAGRAVDRIDLATPRTPEQVTQALQAAGIRAVPTGLDHGTVTAVVGGRGFEVTTLRRDVETDGRHAVVAFTDDWRADAARRDFTINAHVDDARRRGVRLFRRHRPICAPASCASSATRRPASPRTICASCAYFRFFARYAERPRRSRRAGGDPRRRARPCQAVGRTRVERAGPASCPRPIRARRLD